MSVSPLDLGSSGLGTITERCREHIAQNPFLTPTQSLPLWVCSTGQTISGMILLWAFRQFERQVGALSRTSMHTPDSYPQLPALF